MVHKVNGFNRPHGVDPCSVIFEELVQWHCEILWVGHVGDQSAIPHNQHIRL